MNAAAVHRRQPGRAAAEFCAAGGHPAAAVAPGTPEQDQRVPGARRRHGHESRADRERSARFAAQVARPACGQDADARSRCRARWRARQLGGDPRAILPRPLRSRRPPEPDRPGGFRRWRRRRRRVRPRKPERTTRGHDPDGADCVRARRATGAQGRHARFPLDPPPGCCCVPGGIGADDLPVGGTCAKRTSSMRARRDSSS